MRSIWRTIGGDTLRDVALVCLADAIVGMTFGAITVSGGLPRWVPVSMSVLVFAGGAQFATAGVMLAGGNAAAAIAAGLVLNTRLIPYGFAVADILGESRWTRLAGSHVVTDESVAFALRQPDHRRRRAVFWACGAGLFAMWNLAVAAGVLAERYVGNTNTIGLDAVFPAVLLALVLPALADRGTRRSAIAGAALAVTVTPVLPPGIPVLMALAGLAFTIRPMGQTIIRPTRRQPPRRPEAEERVQESEAEAGRCARLSSRSWPSGPTHSG